MTYFLVGILSVFMVVLVWYDQLFVHDDSAAKSQNNHPDVGIDHS